MANFFDQFDDVKAPKKVNAFDQFDATDRGAGRAALQGFNSTVPFGNRVTAGIGAALASAVTGENLGDLYEEARGDQAATSDAHPQAELAGNVAGILATLPIASSKALFGGQAATTGARGALNAIPEQFAKVGNFVRGGKVAADAGALTKAGAVALRGAKAGAVAAPVGGLYAYGNSTNDLDSAEAIGDAVKGAGVAGAIGAALPIAGAAGGAALTGMMPRVSEGLADVAGLAQKYKIPLSLDQVSDSRALKNVQKVSQELPLSGQSAFRERQMLQFNKALFNTVGVDAQRFTPKNMNMAFQKVGGEFDALTKGKSFDIGGEFINDLAATADTVGSTYGKDAAEIFQKEASKVINDFGAGDTISGELISRQRARINALARNATDPNIKGALLDLENNIVDGITSRDPAAQAALSAAKQRYKNLIVLEPIANKAKGGFISPSLLNNRVSQVYKRAHTVGDSGEIGDLARIGHELLPELGGSDTVQKGAYLATGAGALANPASIPAVAATLGLNRAFQSGVNRNQKIISGALARQKRALPIAQAKPLQITINPAGKP